MMRKGVITSPFTTVQWHGHDYEYYDSDAENNEFKTGEEV